MYRVDFNLIEIVDDSLILGIEVPVVAQGPEEAVLAVVGSRHDTLGEVHHPLLQELIRGVQHANELWGESGAPELTRGMEGLTCRWPGPALTEMSGDQAGPQ